MVAHARKQVSKSVLPARQDIIARTKNNIGYAPYFDFIDTVVVPSTWRRSDAITESLRTTYFWCLYWAWFSGKRNKQGYPQVVVSPIRLRRNFLYLDEETGVLHEVVTKKTFFRWLKSLQQRKLILRKRVKDGVRLTIWLPENVMLFLEDLHFSAETIARYRESWASSNDPDYVEPKPPDSPVPMVDRDRKDRDTILEDRDTILEDSVSTAIRIPARLPSNKLSSKGKEYVGKESIRPLPPTDSLHHAISSAKEKSSGKQRFPVTKHRPVTENRHTREFSARWWADMVVAQGKVASPTFNRERISGHNTLTKDWETRKWEEWYRVMETMILTWDAWVEAKNSEPHMKSPLTKLYPPYEWTGSGWWDGWVEWDAKQRQLAAVTVTAKPGSKKTFL
jgi:hypothetical protein